MGHVSAVLMHFVSSRYYLANATEHEFLARRVFTQPRPDADEEALNQDAP